jgi:Ca-activated chloride channel family protein
LFSGSLPLALGNQTARPQVDVHVQVQGTGSAAVTTHTNAGQVRTTVRVEQQVDEWAGRGQVIVPQLGGFPLDGSPGLVVRGVHWDVDVSGPLAVVAMQASIQNTSHVQREAVVMLPVPPGVVIRGFDFAGNSAEPSATLLDSIRARRSYEAIVSRVRDPALLEFESQAAIRSSVFPVPAGGQQMVRVVYEQLLSPLVDGEQSGLELVLCRSEAWRQQTPRFTLDLKVSGLGPLASLWSPTHGLEVTRSADDRLSARLAPSSEYEPGSFRCSILPAGGAPGATLYAHADPRGEGGTFLLLATPPLPKREQPPREVALVLDRSGSMRGVKFEQARSAAIGVLQSLRPVDAFQLVTFNGEVQSFTNGPRRAESWAIAEAVAWLQMSSAEGATNISESLTAVLGFEPLAETLPLVLFLTDGQPTAAITAEDKLRSHVERRNKHKRRLHVLGVGTDVNAPLLDALAQEGLGSSQYVGEQEDPGLALTQLNRRLSQPRLTDIRIELLDPAGELAPDLAQQVVPEQLVDLFEGEPLMLLGRYTNGTEQLGFRLSAKLDGEPSVTRYAFSLSAASPNNAFVSRLWAQKRMVELVDRVRQAGADAQQGPKVVAELVEEIRMLSQRWGVLSEYTAFLALEGTPLANREQTRGVLAARLLNRAQRQRTGQAAVVQSVNQNQWRRGERTDRLGRILTESHQLLGAARLQQIGERSFYLKGQMWIDGRLIEMGPAVAGQLEARAIDFGTNDYRHCCRWLSNNGLAGVLSLPGSALIEIEGSVICLRTPPPPGEPVAQEAPDQTLTATTAGATPFAQPTTQNPSADPTGSSPAAPASGTPAGTAALSPVTASPVDGASPAPAAEPLNGSGPASTPVTPAPAPVPGAPSSPAAPGSPVTGSSSGR